MASKNTVHHIPKIPKECLIMIGRLLVAGRKARGWRQNDLAERLGVSRYTVANIERGDPQVAAGVYFSAAWLLDVPIFSGMETQSKDVIANVLKVLDELQSKRVNIDKQRPVDDDF